MFCVKVWKPSNQNFWAGMKIETTLILKIDRKILKRAFNANYTHSRSSLCVWWVWCACGCVCGVRAGVCVVCVRVCVVSVCLVCVGSYDETKLLFS